jgi:hypothetical protein
MFFRKVARRTAFIGWLIAALSFTSVPQANAAATVHYDSTNGGICTTLLTSASLYANKVVALNSVTINTINVLIGSGSQTNFSTSRYYVMADNPTGGSASNGAPSSVLATFTPDVISGSGSSTVAKFVGNYSVISGTKYWIVSAQNPSVFPMCYRSSTPINSLTMNNFIVDTSTSNNNSGWLRATQSNGTNPVGATWTVSLPDATTFQFSLENNTSTPVVATLGTQSGSLKADYRTVTPLTVSVDTQSKVTFYANGKVISGCRNVLSSSGTATCNWKPSVHGSYRIYAAANPVSSSYVAANTSAITVGVAARTNKR